ncbi:Tat pathway signal sequence domain protein [Streptomyces sp. NR30]|uniref:Tat pathway signal sequence domain protein n=2 Tax=Streptomyces guryensis TaxID=2886947 RepID=A0A9Q3VW47_9ACTN|nr:Tat pathway signal sequence domain protein [Streptomyces guryensis]
MLSGCSNDGDSSRKSVSLTFDKDAYKTKTKTVSTADGEKKVTYRLWEAITYVTKPVDEKYQSLNVMVPVKIGDKEIDASGAPILLDNAIAGYMSSSVTGGSGGGGGAAPSGAPGGGGGMPGGAAPSGGAAAMPSGATAGGAPSGGTQPGAGMTGGGQMVSNGDLALAAGCVIVQPGARGRDNEKNGKYYGKAPAVIVDLKAAVRYIRYNKGRIPGNTDWIVSSGTSAGGAMSALLGASGDSPLYDTQLKEIGAADASDAIFASADWCPITDLDHADMAYEWMYGGAELSGKTVDQTVSKALRSQFAEYQASLNLKGENGFGTLTARNYDAYLLKTYLEPAATKYLKALSDTKRTAYLKEQSWITWSGGKATFEFDDFVTHVGRSKSVPAFDAFNTSAAENIEFGNETTNARHFTLYSLRHATGKSGARLDGDLPEKITLMNPMHFIGQKNAARSKNWWIRVGTSDTATSLTVVGNLAASLKNLGDNVNALMYWDGGHGANEDPDDFIKWIAQITGYGK